METAPAAPGGSGLDAATFRNPSTAYRSVPFWSWNDDLADDELRAQIAAMHDTGQGGFFIHARVGLRTPYLSPRWFDRVRASIDEAARRDLDAWLYDEDKWPSGIAGGLVTAREPAYRTKALLCLVSDAPVHFAEALVGVVGRWRDGVLTDVRAAEAGAEALPDGHALVQCVPWTAPIGQGWFGWATFLDTLNADAVAAFLASTYDRYAREVGDHFGATVPGIFTDEPSVWYPHSLPAVHGVGRPAAVPWTTGLPDIFRARHGYDLRPLLPRLFFTLEGEPDTASVRHDYWETVSWLFYEAWSRQLYDWCERHHLPLTGHHMAEDSLLDQMRWTGGVMPHYRAYHVPGIDKLGRHVAQTVTVKQLDSGACQAGKERALCEAFGCSGQDFAIAGRWWVTNWLLALGVNLLNPHLYLYSLRGERKRDYPPTLSHQQPWWPYQRPYEDAAARLCYALSQGTRQVDLLVLHPMTSAWVAYAPGAHAAVAALDRALARLSEGLLALHHDFHFGDETLLAELATIESDPAGDPLLRVGSQRYRAIVVPAVTTLRRTTVDLLHRFAAAGGPIVALGAGPTRIDGRPQAGPVLPAATVFVADEVADDAPGAWPIVVPGGTTASGNLDAVPTPIPDLPALRAALDVAAPPRVAITGAGADRVWYHARVLPDGRELLFLANTRPTTDADVVVRWIGRGGVERWDPLTGATSSYPSADDEHATTLSIQLARGDSILFVKQAATAAPTRRPDVRRETSLTAEWSVEVLGPNALVLDRCWYRLGSAAWVGPVDVLAAAETIVAAGGGTPYGVRFAFTIDGGPPPDARLVVEETPGLAIAVNGAEVPAADGWWLDRSFAGHPVAALLRAGDNAVELTGIVEPDLEVEAIYLTGNFAVRAEPAPNGGPVERMGQRFAGWQVAPGIETRRPALTSYEVGTDLVGHGLPHFVGEVRLSCDVAIDEIAPGSRVLLALDELWAATAIVEVNGHEVGQLLWPPYDVDITAAARPGTNRLGVRLVTSLRNLLGPLRIAGGDDTSIAPSTFRDRARQTDTCWLVPLGLAGIRLVVAAEGGASRGSVS